MIGSAGRFDVVVCFERLPIVSLTFFLNSFVTPDAEVSRCDCSSSHDAGGGELRCIWKDGSHRP